ncbi:protein argonaute 2 [Elaeis guineensis]|uniref:protein argonaute 2 n=1 Tax=Elaeis guineensis var. tenera TaxID=51953 RepID=UPI000579F19E
MDFQAKRTRGGGNGKGRRAEKHSSPHQPCLPNSSNGTGGSKQMHAPKSNDHGSPARELPVTNDGLQIPSQQLGLKKNYSRDGVVSLSNDGSASSQQSEKVGQGQGNTFLHTNGHDHAPLQAPNAPTFPNTESSALELKNPLEPSHLPLPQQSVGQPLPKEEGRVPMRRPDYGGSSGICSIELLANHFLVKYNEKGVILHYIMDIQREKPTSTYETVKISKPGLLTIKNKLFKTEPEKFPPSMIAYDGERNLYSAIQLPVGEFRVEVHRQTYIIAIGFNKQLELGRLRDQPIPIEVLQGLNVIVREASISQRIAWGRSLFSKTINHAFDLGRGITALEGSKQTLKCTEQGLVLRLEHSVMPFLKPVPVLQFLEKNLGISFNENMQLNMHQKLEVERALWGLQVIVTHRRKQKFTVFGLTGLTAKNIAFKDDRSGKKVRLVEYYRVKHNVKIRFQGLPCLDLSKNQMNYVPMEFCELAEGQKYQKDGLRREEEKRLRYMALASPNKRKEMILRMIAAADGPCSGELAKNFDISVAKDMTQVIGRVLQHPDLRLRNSKGQSRKYRIPKEDCQWNLLKNKLLKGQKLDHWAIIDFSATPSHPKQERLHTSTFIHDLVRRCRDLGIQIQERPLFVQNSSMAALSNYEWLFEELCRAKQSPEGYQVQLLICTMADRHTGYRSLKLICETELGIMTQCCLTIHINNNQKRDHYFTNLALKINAKLGGTNVELFDVLPRMNNCPFMFIGADVNHPASWNTNSPSISAVVATLDYSQASRYAASVRAQSHRKERIMHLGDMCKELTEMYARLNGVKPEKIIYFRDGVSDGQFNMVLNEELPHLKAAIESDHYSPTITVVVAQKRHHTRLFPKDNEKPWNTTTGNVPPGTVVDTGIVDQSTFNFYLCSHYGSRGTSKPTHYYVLHDDHGFTSDELQRLIYNLCFTFARSTKPVSLVPPVYYADLMAYRGRLYYEGLSNLRSPASTISSTSPVSSPFSSLSSVPASFDHVILPKLHRNVEDKMVFL